MQLSKSACACTLKAFVFLIKPVAFLFSGAPNDGFRPNYIKTSSWAIQGTFRYLEMYSKQRYKICFLSVILGKLESFRNYRGFSLYIFPTILAAITL